MKHSQISRITVLALVAISFTLTLVAQAQDTENVLFDFNNTNGTFPADLIQDSAGNLYGTTFYGGHKNAACGTLGCGVVFELSNSGGTWTGKVIYGFLGGNDGASPSAIAMDSNGNIYGTALFDGPKGSGTVFRLTHDPVGSGWIFRVLHSFPDGPTDGKYPTGARIGPDGNFYAYANSGGSTTTCSGQGCGTVFKLSPTSAGEWQETVLHHFIGSPDGEFPGGGPIFDAAGNLYGTASGGPTCAITTDGCGVAFKLSPSASGPWTESILHGFSGGPNGAVPGYVVLDAAGNLYGTAGYGGSNNCNKGCGTIFKLSPTTGTGWWTFSTIYTFTYTGDGWLPSALTIDSSGNLFGAATFAEPGVEGSVYEISPNSSGGWDFNTLYLFADPTTGGAPTALILGSDGNLYGTTETGGDVSHTTTGDGVVFQVVTSASRRN